MVFDRQRVGKEWEHEEVSDRVHWGAYGTLPDSPADLGRGND